MRHTLGALVNYSKVSVFDVNAIEIVRAVFSDRLMTAVLSRVFAATAVYEF